MNLGDLETTKESNIADAPAAEEMKFSPGDIFRQDFLCWPHALLRRWYLIAISAAVCGLLLFAMRYILTPVQYASSAALVRQEVADLRFSKLPPGYNNVQRSVLFNMILSRACLDETARRLKLPYSHDRMFNMLEIKPAEKNSNYFFITATTSSAALSADMANTVAEVFIEDYKNFIRNSLLTINESNVRNQQTLKEELVSLQQRLKQLYETNQLSSIHSEVGNNTQRLLLQEDRLEQSQTALAALKRKMIDFEAQLKTLQPEAIVYSERNMSRDQKLTDMKLELASMLLRYTEDNPIVVQQRHLINSLEKELESKKDNLQKVVTGPNSEYVNITNELAKAKAEQTSLISTIESLTETMVSLKAKRDILNRLAPQIKMLEDQIEQKNDQLLKQESQTKELQLFLERSYSDVSIQEAAIPPKLALPRKLIRFGIIGLFLGGFLCCAVLLIREFLNLTVRSKIDVEKALHLPVLGIIPKLEREQRADFYSALQIAVTNAETMLEGRKRPLLIAVAPYRQQDLDDDLLKELCEIIKIRSDLSYRVINTPTGEVTSDIAPYLINDFIYFPLDEKPKTTRDNICYFKLDDLAFLSPPPEKDLEKVKNGFDDCDIIIWQLFDFELHRQLFSEICKISDLTVVPMRYGKTSKWNVYQMLHQLSSLKVHSIVGLLYLVESKIYRKAAL